MVSVLADLHDEAVAVRCASKGQSGDSLLKELRRGSAAPSLLQLIEWGRQELAMAGFEAVHMIFQNGDVCFESVDVLVELGK